MAALVGLAIGFGRGNGDGLDPYLYPHLPDPLPVLWVRKPVLRFSSPQRAGPVFHLSPSEEEDVESTAYSPTLSPQYEELLEVVTRAVAKLNINWPADDQTEKQRSKLDERFLRSKSLPLRRSLPFLSRSSH